MMMMMMKSNTIIIRRRITTYNCGLPDGVLTPSKLTAYVNLNNQIGLESNNEKETKKKQSKHLLSLDDVFVITYSTHVMSGMLKLCFHSNAIACVACVA